MFLAVPHSMKRAWDWALLPAVEAWGLKPLDHQGSPWISSFLSVICLKDCPFPIELSWHPYQKLFARICEGLFLGSLFHWSMSVFVPTHCFDYSSSVLSFDTRKWFFQLFCSFPRFFWLFSSFETPCEFWDEFFFFCKRHSRDFDRDWIESADCFD